MGLVLHGQNIITILPKNKIILYFIGKQVVTKCNQKIDVTQLAYLIWAGWTNKKLALTCNQIWSQVSASQDRCIYDLAKQSHN